MEKETEEKKIFILHLQTENISNHIENIYQVSLKIIFSLKYIISFFFINVIIASYLILL